VVLVTGTMEPLGAFETPEEMRAETPSGTEGRSKSLLMPLSPIRSALHLGALRLVAVVLWFSIRVMLSSPYFSARAS